MIRMNRPNLWSGAVLLVLGAIEVQAGGSGLNVAVVVNQSSSNSVALGNAYAEQRRVPAGNVVRIQWTGTNTQWSLTDFTNVLRNPLFAALQDRGLTNQIEYVLLSMDIPYRVTDATPGNEGANSTTAVLFYGFKPDTQPPPGQPDSCSLPDASLNSYAFSEFPFHVRPPATATARSFLSFMLTHSNLVDAKTVLDRGVASDGTLPTNHVVLGKSTDYSRNIRYTNFDHAVFEARVTGRSNLTRISMDYPTTQSYLMGYQNGWSWFKVITNLYVPGAMAENLTSYAGLIFELAPWQTNILNWLSCGATASYGTIIEPCNALEKFPSPLAYFYQGRGFNIAESYYQSLASPFQGLLVGEPLASPFARPGSGTWTALSWGGWLQGSTNLNLICTAADTERPLQQVDLFLNERLLNTVTNVAPRQNNQVSATINGISATYTVPAGATIASVATGLANSINGVKNTTQVEAFTHGDRIELRSTLFGRPGSAVAIATTNLQGSAPALTIGVRAAEATFLDTEAFGLRGFRVINQSAPAANNQLSLTITRTNSLMTTVTVLNTNLLGVAGLVQQLAAAVNTHPSLTSPDGVIIEDIVDFGIAADFNVRARSPGWNAAGITAALTASAPQQREPTGTQTLEEYLGDLQPRNHLYLSAGFTNLPVSFNFNSTTQANGFHELTAVAYEGTHVRTQTRVPVQVVISNSPLWATFTTLLGATNSAIESTLVFQVEANTNNISKIELFSTGGLVDTETVNPATLTVSAAFLGPGLHPFHAEVTTTTGQRFRTETRWYRIIESEPPARLRIINAHPPELAWDATAGRQYTVMGSAVVGGPYGMRDLVVPTNTLGSWSDTNTEPAQFYRVRTVW